MSDGFAGFMVGVALMWVVFCLLMAFADPLGSQEAWDCAEQHNVFRCEWVLVPAKP